MQQWRDVKSRHPDALVFFRVGDFYEFFNQDAEEGARLLGLTLTSRNNGAAGDVPLAGVPAKALDDYLARLVRLGRRVAICEQVEDPALAKGIVRREVVEMVTPGTVLHDALLEPGKNVWVMALVPDGETRVGTAALDLSTGQLELRLVAADHLASELARTQPAELVSTEAFASALPRSTDGAGPTPLLTLRPDWIFHPEGAKEELLRSFAVHSLEGLGFHEGDTALIRAAGALLHYVRETQPSGVGHLSPPRIHRSGSVMVLDEMTVRNLELVEPLRAGTGGATLLQVLGRTGTPMGARLLRWWVLHPRIDADEIWARQDAVADLFDDPVLRGRLRDALDHVGDLERIAGRLGTERATPRELLSLCRSLAHIEPLPGVLTPARSERSSELRTRLDPMTDVRAVLEGALADDPPAVLADGGVIREGYDAELDDLRRTRDGAVDFIASLQERERQRTGIGSLKVGYNRVFGYYLEVTHAHRGKVPDDYVRKQTLSNAERYFTPELKQWEEKVSTAEDRIRELEAQLFSDLRTALAAEVARLQRTSRAVAELDVLAALSEVARERGYVRPEVHTGFELELVAGRHPVVETMMAREDFIPNDVRLEPGARLIILTGPNMAGKSTVLRQVGLIQLLAQIGSFVPADRARVPVVDRIFTRVGASDNLVRGQSTFMVEMTETSAILHGATERSLVLLDEIGRGTSTYDGVSIAWAVSEHLHERVGAKTVFATHYHELTQLADLLPAARNMNVVVREVGEDIVFLRRLEAGGADRSYGIQVARLAGLPLEVVARAREILAELEGAHSAGGEGLGRHGTHRPASQAPPDQLALELGEHPVLADLRDVEVDRLTPLEALNLLHALAARARSRG
ncbi:MAG: DNA mismatch repair protein MutS [Gemmatimonadota bacterium]